jgi:hypothetical protein
MGIQLVWGNEEQTVLRHIYDSTWTIRNYFQATDDSQPFLLAANHPVDIIIDMRFSNRPPFGLLPVYTTIERQLPPNQRLVVIVQANTIMRMYNQVIQAIAPKVSTNRHLVNNLDEAYQLIRQCQSNLAMMPLSRAI